MDINESVTAAYIVFSFVSVALLIAPVVWQLKHHNAGAASLGFWIMAGNLVHGINGAIWRRDAIDRAPIWCDISVKIILVYSTACLCSALTVARYVSSAVSPRSRVSVRSSRSKAMDYAFCFGVPALMMATHIIYQPNRYAIVRTVGCEATYVVTWPTFLLWLLWPPIFAVVAAFYASYTVRQLYTSRREMRKLIESTGMPRSRFLRLVAMCCGYTAFSLPLAIYYFVTALKYGGGFVRYDWDWIHSVEGNDHHFGTPLQYVLPTQPGMTDFLALMGAVVYIAFFSFSKEAWSIYAAAFDSVGLSKFLPTLHRKEAAKPKAWASSVTAIDLNPSKLSRTGVTSDQRSHACSSHSYGDPKLDADGSGFLDRDSTNSASHFACNPRDKIVVKVTREEDIV